MSFTSKLIISLILACQGFNSMQGQRAQSIYLEAFGLGGVYSINYDTRFTSNANNNGPGMRVGIEIFEDIAIFPIQVNFLIGGNGKYLELGAGATMVTGVVDFAYGTTGFEAVPTAKIGYRSQPLEGGFTWNIGIISLTTAATIWGGIGIGYAF